MRANQSGGQLLNLFSPLYAWLVSLMRLSKVVETLTS